jgi:hypothetical protein
VSGEVLLHRPHVQHDDIAGRHAGAQFLVAHLAGGVLAEVGVAGSGHGGLVGFGNLAQQCEQLGDVVAGEPVVDAHAFAAGGDEAGLLEGLQVCRGGGQVQPGCLGEGVDGALALGEQVQQFQALSAGQCFAAGREGVVEGGLGAACGGIPHCFLR